jgi:putative hemolysin
VPMNNYPGTLAALALLIVVQGFFVAAEIALVSARRSALQAAADKGSHGARTALRLLDDPTRLLSTISVAITLIGFTASATAAVTFEEPVTLWLRSLGMPWLSRFAGGVSVMAVTLAITYVTLVFGELAPKRLGLQRAESVSSSVAGPVEWLSIAMSPVVWLLGKSTDVVARLLGVKGKGAKSGVTEEEIKLLVTEQGTLLDEEKRMIREVFELGDTVVREIMVPRVDAEMLEDTLSIAQAVPVFERTGFSRMPVFHGDPDTVVGIALLKDLVGPAIAGDSAESVTAHLRVPLFVPETKPILDLLSEMRGTHNHMVVVVDEHGGTAGLCTIEDIVEEVVGEISDEFDREHRFITSAGPDRWIVDGRLSAEEAREQIGVPIDASEEYETVAGWVLMALGHIPQAGEHVRAGEWTVRVLGVRRRRVARLLIVRGDQGPDAADMEE